MEGPALVVVDRIPDPAAVARGLDPASGRDAGDAAWTGVVVDVLRASSTLTRARANGAAAILPFAEPRAAMLWRDAHPGSLACGEREGVRVPGFDLGNSPFEFTRDRVAGRTLAFASTNGSRAMLSLWGCGERWLGAFVCGSAIVRALAGRPLVRIACAGKLGAPAEEDLAFAGWLCSRLAEHGARLGNEAARACAATAPRTGEEVAALVRGSGHGRTLATMGAEFARDVEYCATLDAEPAAFTLGAAASP